MNWLKILDFRFKIVDVALKKCEQTTIRSHQSTISNLKSLAPNPKSTSKISDLQHSGWAHKVQRIKVLYKHFTHKPLWWENLISLDVSPKGLATPFGEMSGLTAAFLRRET